MGVWYEYSKYPFFWEAGQKCQYAIYKNNGNGTVAVKNVGTFVMWVSILKYIKFTKNI